MESIKLKNCREWFKVAAMRSIDDPSGQVERKELVVALDQYPDDFGLGPNPREPVLQSPVSKRIQETLEENGRNFHLLNRGITVVAKALQYDNKSERVRLKLAESDQEEEFFGILDGGNTNARIKQWRTDLLETGRKSEELLEELRKRFVNVQVLVPKMGTTELPSADMAELLNEVKEARNKSVQVKEKSLADARKQFESLKEILAKEPYAANIRWHEGQDGQLDVLQIVTLFVMFYPPFSLGSEGKEPHGAYAHPARCLNLFLDYVEKDPDDVERWMAIVPSAVRLFDELQVTFPKHFPSGRFGGIKEVQIHDEGAQRGNKKYRRKPVLSQYLGRKMKYSYPSGWLFPIYSAFRALVGANKSGKVVWKRDPTEFWEKHGDDICRRYEPHLQAAGYETKRVASNLIAYQAVSQAVKDLYKDELLQKAGIET
jgi:AIPR protein